MTYAALFSTYLIGQTVRETFEAHQGIIPIVRLTDGPRIVELLGTGFYVGPLPVIVTAKHVLTGAPLNPGENYAVPRFSPQGRLSEAYIINKYSVSPTYDIAVLDGQGIQGAYSLKLSRTQTALDHDVLTYEYSQTSFELAADGIRYPNFQPFAHKGNIMRYYNEMFGAASPTPSFVTSFPVLQGASGAPVLRTIDPFGSSLAVVGMVVANHERPLLPAQVVRIETAKNEYEEVRYFLPTGIAINANVVIDYLEEVGAQPEVVT